MSCPTREENDRAAAQIARVELSRGRAFAYMRLPSAAPHFKSSLNSESGSRTRLRLRFPLYTHTNRTRLNKMVSHTRKSIAAASVLLAACALPAATAYQYTVRAHSGSCSPNPAVFTSSIIKHRASRLTILLPRCSPRPATYLKLPLAGPCPRPHMFTSQSLPARQRGGDSRRSESARTRALVSPAWALTHPGERARPRSEPRGSRSPPTNDGR